MANTVKIILEADDKTKGAFDQAKSSTEGLISTLKSHWLAITATATATLLAANRTINFAKEIASANSNIQRQSAVLGMSTSELQKWQYAAKMSNVNVEEFAMGIKLLSANMEQAAIGSDISSRYFTAMGVSVKTSEGNLRPLNEVMGDIMDKFASWEDGPRKIAIAIQLFGRSGETMIPLLNRGKSGFEDLAREAQKLGIILSPDLVKKGSEANEIFEKLEARSKATKMSLAPLALEFAKTIDSILKDFNRLNDWLQKNKTTDWFPQLKDLNQWLKENSLDQWLAKVGIYTKRFEQQEGEKIEKMGVPSWIKEWVAGQGKKGQPPIIPPEGAKSDIVKEVMTALESVIKLEEERGEIAVAQHELMELGWAKEKDIVDQVKEAIENMTRAEEERGEIAISIHELEESSWEAEKKQLEVRRQMSEVDINRQIAAIRLDRDRLAIGKEDALRKEIELQTQLLAIYETQIKKVDQIVDPAGYMALYNAMDGVRGKLNELTVQLETTTGTALQGFIRGIKEYADEIKSTFEITRDAAKGTLKAIGDSFENLIVDSLTGKFKSWRDVWNSLLNDMIKIFAKSCREMAESWINDFLKKILGTGGATSGGGGILDQLLKSIFGGGSQLKITGGAAGITGSGAGGSASFDTGFDIGWSAHTGRGPGELPSFYRLIPRFHSGIGPDEVLSIIRKNESVLTPAQMKALAPAGNFTLSMPISIGGPIDRRTAQKLRDETERFIIDKLKEYSR